MTAHFNIAKKYTLGDLLNKFQLLRKNGIEELNKYINDNGDPGILNYANEMTLASLFLCGNVRRNQDITGVQEYGVSCTTKEKGFRGKPDIFMRKGANAVWIECKNQKKIKPLKEDHWNIDAWLEWDKKKIFIQLEDYYQAEKNEINDTYERHFLVSLCFKNIQENEIKHLSLVNKQLRAVSNLDYQRGWFYQVGFQNTDAKKQLGIEVYGTFTEKIFKK